MGASEQELQEFRTEATELLEVAERSLLEIGAGAEFRVAFDSVFRCFHNLKGAAGMMELLELQSHTHELETTLMKLKDGSTIPNEQVSYFLRGIDRARGLLSGDLRPAEAAPSPVVERIVEPVVETERSEAVVATLVVDGSNDEFFAECEEIIERVSDNLRRIEAGSPGREPVDALYRDFHSLKGTSYLFGFVQLGDIAHLIENALEPVRDGALQPGKPLIDGIFGSLKVIEMELQCLRTGQTNARLKGLRAALSNVLSGLAAKSLVPSVPSQAFTPPPPVEAPKEPIMETAPSAPAAPQPLAGNQPAKEAPSAREKEAENSTIRVSVSLLDNLMTLMGEMVLVRNQVLQFSNNSDDLEFQNLSKRLNAVTSEIQDELMKTRMQPIGNILNKFSRVVRDLSQELGKAISLSLSGAETELDKSLLEAIKDPLTHIVRNSCDHGIEPPEARSRAGKPEVGSISIRSFHEGGQVVIEVSDDGKGLDPGVLLRKGIEKGLVSEAQAKAMGEKEIFNLIFAAGFSTAAKITNVSGRGVGMDVVRTNIERIGGTVDLSSVTGKGTTITIKIPLTLAIVPALIVDSGSGTFAIPQVKLSELVRVDLSSTENRIEYLQGAPVYRLRGSLLPLVDLNQVLGLGARDPSQARQFVNIAVLNADDRCFGLIVDEIRDTADIVVKPLNRLLKSLMVYSGATILGDGEVALILDVQGLSRHAQIGRDGQAGARIETSIGDQAKRVSTENQDYILVKLGSPTKHAIVLGYVHRLEEFKRSEIEQSGAMRVIRYRDSLLHVVSADKQLGYPAAATEAANPNETVPIIVVDRAGTLFGIEVGAILDTLSSEVDPETGALKQPGIYGTLNLPNELVVVVDPFELISTAYPEPESSREAEPPAPAEPVGRLRILLVEDTVFFKRAIAKVLQHAGHDVIHASDGQEAFELYSQRGGTFDLIVSDIEMPRMDGFQLARAVRSGKTRPEVPMLAISSRASAQYRARGLEAGFGYYLEKLKPETLLNAIAELASAGRKKAS